MNELRVARRDITLASDEDIFRLNGFLAIWFFADLQGIHCCLDGVV
jgi:hypothetical protein